MNRPLALCYSDGRHITIDITSRLTRYRRQCSLKTSRIREQQPYGITDATVRYCRFVRETYVQYALPLLPQFSAYRSPRFVNRGVIEYVNEGKIVDGKPLEIAEGPPTREQDEWLENPENWPDEDEQYLKRVTDLISRNLTSAMLIADKEKFGRMMGGQFDFGEDVEKAVTEIFGGKEQREDFEKKLASHKK